MSTTLVQPPPFNAPGRPAPIPTAPPDRANTTAPVPDPSAATTPNLRGLSEKVFVPVKDGVAGTDGPISPNGVPATPAKTEAPAAPKTPAATETPVKAKETTPVTKAEASPKPEADASKESDPFAGVREPEFKNPAGKEGWDLLKGKVVAAEKKYNEAIAQLDTYKKATPADIAEAARLKEELKQAHDRLAVLDVQSHPDFSKQYVEPKKKALSEASTLIADNGIEGAPNLADLMTKPRAEFSKVVSELAAKMPAFDQGSFVASMREAYRLNADQQTAISKASELKSQLDAKAAAAARTAFEEGKTEFNTRIPPLPIPEGADEARIAQITEFNKAREAALAEAERFAFGKISEREVAGIATRAASLNLLAHHVLPAVQKENADLRSLNQQMAQELASIKAAKNPGKFTQSAESPRPQTAPGTPTDPLGLRALSAKTFGAG